LVLAGKAALVTGGGRGLGRAIALALAAAGADVMITGRDPARLADVAREIREAGRTAVAYEADSTTPGAPAAAVDAALAGLGRLDILVNNSGVAHVGPAVDTTDEIVERVIATNVIGTFAYLREAGRVFVEQRSGKVVNVASHLGVLGRSQFAVYCASKSAVIGMTKALALEWARFGIQVNAVAPGLVKTDMNGHMRADETEAARVLQRIPARRMATPDEIAPFVVMLASPASDFMTGETIVIDGGETAGR
jgi:2-deoxy-D-gluconate 3-dehydrogenase